MEHTNNTLNKVCIKSALYVVLLYVLFVLTSSLFTYYINWEQSQDIRKRILWDFCNYGSSSVVLIGDSIFNSNYVTHDSESIWENVKLLTNKKIFNGALNSVKANDFLSQVRVINKNWPKNTVAVIDINVIRFSRFNKSMSVSDYADYFNRIIPNVEYKSLIDKLSNKLIYYVSYYIPLLKIKDIIPDYVNYVRNKPNASKYTIKDNNDIAIWINDANALKQFEYIKKVTDYDKLSFDFKLIKNISNELITHKNIPLFVITPWNKCLILSADRVDGKKIENYYNRIHVDLINFLRVNNIEYLDLSDSFSSDYFADVLHPNKRGDELVANKISEWLNTWEERK